MLDVYGESRQHLLDFLNRVVDGSVTSNELENFVMIGYQTETLEEVRITVVEIITSTSGAVRVSKSDLSGSDRAAIKALIAGLG